MNEFFKDREILITGGTGSLGKTLVKLLLAEHRPKGIRVFSRDELKQWVMKTEIEKFRLEHEAGNTPVSYLIGDVRDAARVRRAFRGVDVVLHTAAMKQVPACEDNPKEAVLTNVHGALNVMDAAIDCSVARVMNVSTDKAVKSVNLYGMTKATAEKLIVDGNVYAGGRGTLLSSCRYGNVLGSRGSVAHVFKACADAGEPIPITHAAMTRFWIALPTVARFLLARCADMQGGEIFVPKMKSMGVHDMGMVMGSRLRCECHPERQGSILCPWCDGTFPAETILPEFKVTGIRQGEKLHELLFAEEDYVYEFGDHYRVFASRQIHREAELGTARQWEFSSARNPNGDLTDDELQAMLVETGL